MAYIKDAVLDELSEGNRLIMTLISRLDKQAAAMAETDTAEERVIVFINIRFLAGELSRLTTL